MVINALRDARFDDICGLKLADHQMGKESQLTKFEFDKDKLTRMLYDPSHHSCGIALIAENYTELLTGFAAGGVASLAGVGGGIILVPAYNRWHKRTLPVSVATSSATIVFISMLSVLHYLILGHDSKVPDRAIGFVDFPIALSVGIPSIFGARLGVFLTRTVSNRMVQIAFALLALAASARLLLDGASAP